ncbi:MAG: hypothetical protein CSA60_02660 [Neptuniibacter caesariensis]|uniref:LPS-assembly protein LptD n=1 Tax=Neptuniibacter caesariensis TaxID=207954 RepID=A0A2G6JN77_NEPCE|nr:MAG: hypothetical protein CSA60_02660 [Neptuniibacter caesariensis]
MQIFRLYLSGVRQKPDSPEIAETDLVTQMPFAKRPTYTLTLAISAALLASHSAAESTSSQDEMAWSCSMVKDGDWDCTVNEELINQSQTSPAQPEPVVAKPEPAATKPKPSVNLPKQASAKPEEKSAAAQQDIPQAQATVAAVREESADQGQTTAAAATKIQAEPAGAMTTAPRQPAAKARRAKQPATPTRNASANKPVTTSEVVGNEWQCSTGPSGDWDCNKVNVHAIAALRNSKRRSGHKAPGYITENPYSRLDWVYYQNTAGQQCSGRYLEPSFPKMGDEDSENPPVHLEAGSSSTVIGGLSRLYDGVKVRQGSRRLSASSAELDQVTNKGLFEGNVVFREPGLLINSDSAQIYTTTSEAVFSNAQFLLHEDKLRGDANRIIRLEDKRLRIEQGAYTYCPPDSDAWQLTADSMVLNQEQGYGEAEDAVLRIAGVPVLYTPYFTFPIDDTRRSGFLYPSFGYSKGNGIDITVPYYFNISPNLDDTLTTRYLSDRGLILENELRYLNTWSNNTISTAYMPDDDIVDEDRWLVSLKHSGKIGNHWRTSIDYTAVSDNDYFEDLDTNLDVSRQDHLNQRAEISYNNSNWQFLAKVHDYQTIDATSMAPYERLPQLELNGRETFADNGLMSLHTDYTRFDRKLDGLTGSDRITGERGFIMPSASYKWHAPWGYIKPELSLWSSSYALNNQLAGADDSPNINNAILSVDSGLIFERKLKSGGIQTLEPRLFALYVPYKDHAGIPDFDTSELGFSYSSLFRRNRFSGLDRLGDTQQLSLGLSTRFYGNNGNETANFSIGQAYYFADRKVQLSNTTPADTSSQSDIAIEGAWYPSPGLSLSLNTVHDHSDYSSKETNARIRYRGDFDHQFDFNYRFTKDQHKQTDLSFIWPINPQWTTMGRWLYDLEGKDSLETSLGLEYASCCWKVSFSGRRWLDNANEYDTGFFLNFTLKGLGSFGSGGNGFMNDIIGYKEREEQNED